MENVLLPYGFTLFSNDTQQPIGLILVLLPYGFTLFSNYHFLYFTFDLVLLPYGFTLFSNQRMQPPSFHLFYYLMDLHYSQT